MNHPKVASLRHTWFLIFGAFCVSVLSYEFAGYIVSHNPASPLPAPTNAASLTPVAIVLAFVSLLASLVWLRLRMDGGLGNEGRELDLSPKQFRCDSVIALALSKTCTVLGLLLLLRGAPFQEFTLFVLATLLVNCVFILPRGLRFWSAYEKAVTPQSVSLSPFEAL